MPSNKTWGAALAYSAKRSRFMALASDGDIAVSTDDGATWSAGTATGLTEGHSLAVLGSLWLAAGEGSAKVGLCGSLDDGATWFPIFRSAHAAGASSSGLVHVGVNGQVCFVSTDGSTTTAYWTPPLGYPDAGT
ncbi:MAG TPA: hypothetical protein VFR23_24650 [Jiangellaceae bacterium]|nr:hypothetical protein [Jiangellaceae bacterium]